MTYNQLMKLQFADKVLNQLISEKASPFDIHSADFKNMFAGKRAYIVGKGGSYLKLNSNDFKDGIIITINDAIKHIETLQIDNLIISMQKDGSGTDCNKDSCGNCGFMSYPHNAYLLIHALESANCLPDYMVHKRLIFNNHNFGLEQIDFSAMSAIAICEWLGIADIVFYGFDSVNGDLDSYYPDGTIENSNFINYRLQIERQLEYLKTKKINCEFKFKEG